MPKALRHEDFEENEAWLVFRIDGQVQSSPIDIYLVMELSSGQISGPVISDGEKLKRKDVSRILDFGKTLFRALPRRLLLVKGDSIEKTLAGILKKHGIALELVPASAVETLIAPVKEEFGHRFYSPSSIGYTSEESSEKTKHFVPDSFDPCWCASGKKFKFCCKPVLREIVNAMVAAEDGNIELALEWIAKAKSVVGETAEILCRESIVYGFFDPGKSIELLKKCLQVSPSHPRANYLAGVMLKERDNLEGAVIAYETAIENYPKSDRFHLSETYNNLGSTLYEMGDFEGAKIAWEKGLILLPSDDVIRRNLREFIYDNEELPPELRKMGSLVRRFWHS